jgi:transcriptional regulator with XRE-family HTH domain
VARSELALALRAARHERGITQSRLSAALGVPAALVGRWEHGEAVPDTNQVGALGDALGVDRRTAETWLELRTRVLAGRRPEPRGDATVTDEILPPPVRTSVAVAEPPPPPPAADQRPRARGRVRRSQERARRAARSSQVTQSRATERAGDEARRRSGRSAAGMTAPPVFAPDLLEERSHVIATVNSGAVFPVPGSRRTIDKLTYSTGAPTYRVTVEDRMVYRSRWMRVVLILLGLLTLLWWAVTQLGDGWDAVLDLFRSDDAPTTTIGALILWFLPASG